MKEKIRDGLILLNYLLGVSTVRNFMFKQRGKKNITRIVSFHKIKDIRRFENQIRFIFNNFHVIGLDDFLQNKTIPGKINVCLTFDDGYRSWLKAVPILQQFRAPATFFVCSEYLDEGHELSLLWSARQLKVRPEASLTWDELKEISRLPGFQIGGHTVHHLSLGEMDDECAISREISDDKRRIEEMIKQKIFHFAYPFGHPQSFNQRVATLVKNAGYKCAVTLIPGINGIQTNRFLLHRDCIDDLDSSLVVKAWLLGNYDLLKKLSIVLAGKGSF